MRGRRARLRYHSQPARQLEPVSHNQHLGLHSLNTNRYPSSLNTSCILNKDLSYCVQVSILHVANITQYCTHEDQPSFGQTCDQFLQTWDLDYETFEAFNPGIGAKCDNWKLGKPSDVLPLIRDKADRFHPRPQLLRESDALPPTGYRQELHQVGYGKYHKL